MRRRLRRRCHRRRKRFNGGLVAIGQTSRRIADAIIRALLNALISVEREARFTSAIRRRRRPRLCQANCASVRVVLAHLPHLRVNERASERSALRHVAFLRFSAASLVSTAY